MNIIIRDTGKEYPRKYKEGKEEYWEKALMKIWKNHMVKGVAPINEIDTVYIGNSSMPFNEIILFNGKRFYDEDNSPQWAYIENQKTLKKMWSRNGL